VILIPLRDERNSKNPLWRFYAIGSNDKEAELLDFVDNLPKGTRERKAAESLLGLINHIQYLVRGPQDLQGTKYCHEAISGEGIYEFIKKPIRIYWFYGDSDKVVICAYGVEKRWDKTDKNDRKRLIRLRDDYVKDLSEGCISIIE
jgi:hypothetical protein